MLLEFLSKIPLGTLIGLLLSFAGIVVAIVVAFLQENRKQLGYKYKTKVIFRDKQFIDTGLNIHFNEIDNEKRIDQLSETSVEIRNVGNVRIEERYDVYEDAKLKIVPETKGVEIIFAKVVSESDNIIKCSAVKTKSNEIEVHFNAIEKKKNIVINVYHSGNQDEKFNLSGRIKDGQIIKLKTDDRCKALARNVLIFNNLLNALFFIDFLSQIHPVASFTTFSPVERVLTIAIVVLCCLNVIMIFAVPSIMRFCGLYHCS